MFEETAMSKATSETILKSVLCVVFAVVGLVILGFVSMTALKLATGVIKPLTIIGEGISPETGIFWGIFLQMGMFAVLIAIAFALIYFGLTLIPSKEA